MAVFSDYAVIQISCCCSGVSIGKIKYRSVMREGKDRCHGGSLQRNAGHHEAYLVGAA